ncbi:hypothetical protein MAP00_003021 [Monascus purpureus]|nr:hypothetical protein MAP00_003021 [Monascus purpureus]
MSSEPTRLRLPGWTLPLNHKPFNGEDDSLFPEDHSLFSHALDYMDIERGDANRITVHRELVMLRVMNSITDKPEWDRKVFDKEIMAKWREEISRSGEDVTQKMMDWITTELQWKAGVLHKTGIVVAFEPGVVKSDTAVPKDVQQALKEAAQPLEDVPEEQKDYHPNSDNQVLDLVHPSLFPVIYGRSRILSDGLIGRDDCFGYIGQGEVLKEPPLEERGLQDTYQDRYSSCDPFSGKFQWMPCDVKFTEEGGCRIASYINNLHPQKNRGLYGVIERILAQTIPLWDVVLTHVENEYKRIEYYQVNYLDHPEPEPVQDDGDDYWERYSERESRRPIEIPEPDEFEPSQVTPCKKINLRERFAETGLQVIVKLANIELTPEKPEYDGGSWHVEGQLNEHICASAVYYYDIENITERRMVEGEQNEHFMMYDFNLCEH